MKRFSTLLHEVKIIGKNLPRSPLKDSDTIRVYHGASELATVVKALKYGLTGDTRANRRYSYEFNNNPKGLFVTPDLDVAKEFGDYIIEFQTRVSDLEAPVWPGGSFTVQGGMSGTFSDEEEREIERIAQRERISKDAVEYIAKSDKPDVAYWLMDAPETQALFTGNLNKNSVRAVWVSSNPAKINQPYNRMKPREFMKEFEEFGIENRFGGRYSMDDIKKSDAIKKSKQNMFDPRDDVTLEMLVQKYMEKFNIERDHIISILKDNPDYVARPLWNDKQIAQVQAELDKIR